MTVTLTRKSHRKSDFATLLESTSDPIGFEAGDANVRRYVGNHSNQYRDPTGLFLSSDAYFTAGPGEADLGYGGQPQSPQSQDPPIEILRDCLTEELADSAASQQKGAGGVKRPLRRGPSGNPPNYRLGSVPNMFGD